MRLRKEIDPKLHEKKASFRTGCSCREQIFTLRNIIEQSLEYQIPMTINYINFKKVFDSIHRPSLWNILSIYRVPLKYTNIFKALYTDSSCCVKTETGVTDFFTTLSGVQQGCILSPLFFLILLDLTRKAIETQESGIKLTNTDQLSDLDFADDLPLLANNSIQLQQMNDSLKSNAGEVGQSINTSKTKIQRIRNWNNNTTPITYDKRLLEEVQRFKYLGSYQTSDGNI